MLAILTAHCPALRQQPDVLGCLPGSTGIRLITDRPALMPTEVAGLPVVTEPPPPHLPPPPGVIVVRAEGAAHRPTLSECPAGYTEVQKYRWRFCLSETDPQPIPTGLMSPPIAGIPYIDAEAIFQQQDFMDLPGVQSVSLGAAGIVVQTTEPALIPSTFAGLPVRTEAPQGVFHPINHTLDTLLSPPRKGGIAIGPSSGPGGGTLGGFVWSGGEPWLVVAAHNFPAKCGEVPPCPACDPDDADCPALHQCPHDDTNGILAKRAPLSPTPPTVSTLTRWTQLTHGATVKTDVAAGFVDVQAHPLSRRLQDFGRMVTGHVAAVSMRNTPVTIISAADRASYWGRSYKSSHVLSGKVTAVTTNLIEDDDGDDDRVGMRCPGEIRVNYRDVFEIQVNAQPPDESGETVIHRDYILPGTSGALVIDGSGRILGMMFNGVQDVRERAGRVVDRRFTRKAHAMKAKYLKTALKFEKWVGSETVPLEGALVSLAGVRPQMRGWAYDPLHPRAALTVEV